MSKNDPKADSKIFPTSVNRLYNYLEEKCEKHRTLFFFISLALMVIFGLLLFDVRISEGGDDSAYLMAAQKFADGIAFPGFHGTFYSLFIGYLIRLFGFHLIFFKLLSLLFLVGQQVFFYLAFRNRISSLLLNFVLLITAVNSDILFFASQTYTEALFMFLQAIFFYVFLTRTVEMPNNFRHIRNTWGTYLIMALVFLMLTTTRNVGLVALLTVLTWFLLERKFIPAIYTFVSYVLIKLPYDMYKRFAWGITTSDLAGQISSGLQKNPYNRALGTENFKGMLIRVLENSRIYLSREFLQIIGLKSEKNNSVSIFWTVIIFLLLVTGLALAYRRKRKTLLTVFLYTGFSLGITFISLSQLWSQSRLIIIYIPMMILCLAWVLTEIDNRLRLSILKYFALVLLGFVFVHEGIVSVKKADHNYKILAENLEGQKLFGYAPDLQHYLELSEWVSKNIPKGNMVACRYASMSFIYANGRFFYPIYTLPRESSEGVLNDAVSTGEKLLFIREKDLQGKTLQPVLYLEKRLYAIIDLDHEIYGIYTVNKQDMPEIKKNLAMLHLNPITDVGYVRAHLRDRYSNPAAVEPGKLFSILRNHKVNYIIRGTLRYDRARKTNLTVNTVERFMEFTDMKYPGIFHMIKQVGANNNEPARLYKVNYKG